MSDFPTNEVRRLEVGIREETRAYIKFLEDVSSDISEIKELLSFLKSAKRGDTENITILENKIKEMKEAQEKTWRWEQAKEYRDSRGSKLNYQYFKEQSWRKYC